MSQEHTIPTRGGGLPLGTLRVEVVAGPDAGKIHVAETDTVTVGSAQGNSLVLSDGTVSRYHLELVRRDDRIGVVDLNSTNGTEIGGVRVERGSIRPRTVVTIGRTQLRVDHGASAVVEVWSGDRLGRIRGRGPSMSRLMAQIERAAKSDASVLLLGETGTGKEVIAHAIHEASPRASKPFETVDCGSLMPTLIASELFGHEKGAFTGANELHRGAFERANGGTIFLDEIGELPAALQPVLLGALERRSFRRVGGKTPISVDVRVVSATHRDLRAEVNSGSFRQDLYFRLAVVLLQIPALRDRLEDLPLLVEHFLTEAGHAELAASFLADDATLQALRGHHWPGNVRELRNFVDAALALGEPPDVAQRTTAARPGPAVRGYDDLLDLPFSDAKAQLVTDFEATYLGRLMEKTRQNISQAAREAGMNRAYFLEMLKRHGIR